MISWIEIKKYNMEVFEDVKCYKNKEKNKLEY